MVVGASTHQELLKCMEIIQKSKDVFKVWPCTWQLDIVLAMLQRRQHIVCISGTGSGKTLPFWLPLLFTSGIQIVVTALNLLSKQNESQLQRVGISAISLAGETCWQDKTTVCVLGDCFELILMYYSGHHRRKIQGFGCKSGDANEKRWCFSEAAEKQNTR